MDEPTPERRDARLRREGIVLIGGCEYLILSSPVGLARGATALTQAEREVLDRLREGDSYRSIAARRKVSPSTISNQVQSAFRKLGIHSRRELEAATVQAPSAAPAGPR